MPSFDIVSEIDAHELSNAVDQMRREISTRYDFRGSDVVIELKEKTLKVDAESEFQLGQVEEIIYSKLAKRGIDTRCMEKGEPEPRGRRCLQDFTVREGIDKDLARKIVKLIKETKLKVQAAVQGEQVRVTGKKRDDLQQVMAMLKANDSIDMPLQYTNFRD